MKENTVDFNSLLKCAAKKVELLTVNKMSRAMKQELLRRCLLEAIGRLGESVARETPDAPDEPLRITIAQGYKGDEAGELCDEEDAEVMNHILLDAAKEAVLGFLTHLVDEKTFKEISVEIESCDPFC